MRLLTEDLVTSVKLRAFVPISQQTFTDDMIIQALNEELYTRMVPLLVSVREDFFLTYKHTPLTNAVSLYPIPERAIGDSLKDIWRLDSTYNRQGTLARVQVHNLGSTDSGTPGEFVLLGDELQVNPVPNATSGYLEIWYLMKPNRLVATTSCAKITAVSSVGGTTTLTVDTDLTASVSVGALVDVVSGKSPHMLWGMDAAVTAISSTQIALLTSSVADETGAATPQVGDYVALSQTSCVPMLPQELHPVLAQMGAVRLLQSLGDLNKLQQAKADLNEMAQLAFKLVSNRVESELETVMNRHGFLAASGTLGRGFLLR